MVWSVLRVRELFLARCDVMDGVFLTIMVILHTALWKWRT